MRRSAARGGENYPRVLSFDVQNCPPGLLIPLTVFADYGEFTLVLIYACVCPCACVREHPPIRPARIDVLLPPETVDLHSCNTKEITKVRRLKQCSVSVLHPESTTVGALA